MRNQYVTGENRDLVLEALPRFVTEADILCMNGVNARVTETNYLQELTENQYNFVRGSGHAYEGEIICLLDGLQYLLRSYATSTATQQANIALADIFERPGVVETDYLACLNKAFHLCGTVYPVKERCTISTDWVDLALWSLVAWKQ